MLVLLFYIFIFFIIQANSQEVNEFCVDNNDISLIFAAGKFATNESSGGMDPMQTAAGYTYVLVTGVITKYEKSEKIYRIERLNVTTEGFSFDKVERWTELENVLATAIDGRRLSPVQAFTLHDYFNRDTIDDKLLWERPVTLFVDASQNHYVSVHFDQNIQNVIQHERIYLTMLNNSLTEDKLNVKAILDAFIEDPRKNENPVETVKVIGIGSFPFVSHFHRNVGPRSLFVYTSETIPNEGTYFQKHFLNSKELRRETRTVQLWWDYPKHPTRKDHFFCKEMKEVFVGGAPLSLASYHKEINQKSFDYLEFNTENQIRVIRIFFMEDRPTERYEDAVVLVNQSYQVLIPTREATFCDGVTIPITTTISITTPTTKPPTTKLQTSSPPMTPTDQTPRPLPPKPSTTKIFEKPHKGPKGGFSKLTFNEFCLFFLFILYLF